MTALRRYSARRGRCLIINSLEYGVVPKVPGNIKLIDNKVTHIPNDGGIDEIDVVFVTSYRIFLIEVKTYRRKNIRLTNTWEYKSNSPAEKSVITQTEKHARQFYYNFYPYIPDGNPDYIIPLIVFVDKCHVTDERDIEFKNYIPVCVINKLNKLISVLDTPLDNAIDIDNLLKGLKSVAKMEELVL
jgi:hypothetical protein